MFNFCHNNYIKYGWGNQLYGKRESSEDKFWFEFGRCEREPLDFREECLIAAKLMYESTEKKLIVHFSGGIDGEIICLALLKQNLPFEVCVWKYNDDINKHDIDYTFKFCNTHNVKCNVIEIDVLKFLQVGVYERYNSKFFCPFWFTNLCKWAIEQLDGYHVFGDGNLYFNHDPLGINSIKKPVYIPPIPFHPSNYISPPILEAKIYETIVEAQHGETTSFLQDIGKEGCQGFFHYTPELLLSYIRDPMVKDWLSYCYKNPLPNNKLYPGIDSVTKMHMWMDSKTYVNSYLANSTLNIRPHIKYRYWPELEIRPKYNGMEKIRQPALEEIIKLGKQYPYNSPGNEVIFIQTNKFIENLEGVSNV